MGIVRNTAHRLADFTARHASPGSKVWAEALANELDSIKGDWRAFAWAIGSMRVLLRYRPEPIHNLAELGASAEKYASRRRHAMNNTWLGRNVLSLAWTISALTNLPQLFRHKDVAGNSMYICTWLSLALVEYLRNREPNVPDRDDLQGMIRFYRQDLTRQSRLFAPEIFSAGMFLPYVGSNLTAHPWGARLMGALWLVLVAAFVSRYLVTRHQLTQIEAVLAASDEF